MEIILNKYILLKKVGSGGQGEVFLAKIINHDFGLEKKVVIKFFPKNDIVKKYFINEVKALSKIDHQNIVSILDASETSDKYILVLEYINGLNLKEFCANVSQKKITINPFLLIEITHKVFMALNYAHSAKHGAILHRDISPHNILIADDGRVKLIDFGISQIEGDAFNPSSKGKASYLPEQVVSGSKVYDATTDFFSLGITLQKSFEDIGLEVNFDFRNLIKYLKSFDGDYDGLNEVFTKVLKSASGDLNQNIEQVFDKKFIVENTEVSIEEVKDVKAKSTLKKRLKYAGLTLLGFIIISNIIIYNVTDKNSELFAIYINNGKKLKLKIIAPDKAWSPDNIENSREYTSTGCEIACYQAIYNLTIGHISNYEMAIKTNSMPSHVEGLNAYFESSYHYYKVTNLFLDKLAGKCDEEPICKMATKIKKLLNTNVDINQPNNFAISDFKKFMSNTDPSSLIVSNIKIIDGIRTSEMAMRYSNAKIATYNLFAKYQLINFEGDLTIEACRIIGDAEFLRQVNTAAFLGNNLDSSFAVTISNFKDSLPDYDNKLAGYVLKTTENMKLCSYKRANGEITYLNVWKVK